MNTLTFECEEKIFPLIPKDIREFITVVKRRNKDFDFSDYKEWRELQIISLKNYLIKLEYENVLKVTGEDFDEHHEKLRVKARKSYKELEVLEYEILKKEGKLN